MLQKVAQWVYKPYTLPKNNNNNNRNKPLTKLYVCSNWIKHLQAD